MLLLIPELRLCNFCFQLFDLFALSIEVKDTSSALPAFHLVD